jgi:hypothetical protein
MKAWSAPPPCPAVWPSGCTWRLSTLRTQALQQLAGVQLVEAQNVDTKAS